MDPAERQYGSRLDRPISPRLTQLVDGVAADLARQLAEIQVENDLTRRELLAVQDAMSALHRKGEAPAANDYWARDAQPRARRLSATSIAVIDERFDSLPLQIAGALIAGSRLAGAAAAHRVEGDQPTAGAYQAQQAGAEIETGHQAYARLRSALPQPTLLTDIGHWWQRRLRRAAIISAIPAVIVGLPGESEAAIANREMYLLDRPPWCHGDRLLSAFELAHSDIVSHGRARIVEALDDILPSH